MKKVIGFLMILILILQVNLSIAASKSELENEKKDINSEITNKKEEIQNIQEEKSGVLKEVEQLMNQISQYESEIQNLQERINALQNEIDTAQANIKEKEEQYTRDKELLDERLINICEKGETSYLTVLLGSEDIVDFMSRYYTISELVEYDTLLLETIEKERQAIEEEKAKLENDQKELNEAQKAIEEKNNEVKSKKASKDKYVSQLSQEEKEAQKELEKFEKDKKQIEAELKRIAEEEARRNNSGNIAGKPSSSGYIFPIPGLGKSNINNKTYPSYAGHTGVDININVIGKNVVAVKDGTVVTSTAISGSIPNYGTDGKYVGSYSSYGEYVVINHHDGTMTLYGHMKAGSRRVSAGQEVKQGQVIGIVGNTGNCQPRPTSGNPLSGTHLHFEVRINGSPVNPLPYLP